MPERAIIFFDGVCGLCNGFVHYVLKRDRRRRFLFSPLQGKTACEILGAQPNPPDTVVLVDAAGTHVKSDAVLRILYEFGGLWRLSTALFAVPRRLRNFVYDFIARKRYARFGKADSCYVPTPRERDRFLP